MSSLNRHLAPLSTEAWKAVEHEARRELSLRLAARRVVDLKGPLGWETSAVNLGRIEPLSGSPVHGVAGALRRVQPLVELRVPFELARDELDTLDRGAGDADLEPVNRAARAIAQAEDLAVFHGYPEAGVEGICQAAGEAALTLTDDYERYPAVVAQALARLRAAGVGGPYAIALGPRCYTGLTRTTTRGGFPVMQHVQRLLDGPVIWAPSVRGAVVVSQRGGDFELTLGRDFAIGYHSHTGSTVTLYLEESLTFRTLASEAAVPLAYEDEHQHMDEKLDEALKDTFPASDAIELTAD